MGGCDSKPIGRDSHYEIMGRELIECLRKERGIVLMAFRDDELLASTSRLPAFGRGWLRGISMFESQSEPEPEDGNLAILGLAASLGCLGRDACRDVPKHDGGFRLVAMLPAWPAAARSRLAAFREEICGRQSRRMHVVAHGSPDLSEGVSPSWAMRRA